tara:strand:+ start:801 stop:992 length:192 start_codon:yes stop_codon:yes gene_type:complete
MGSKSESSKYIQGSLFSIGMMPTENNPEIAFSALKQIHRLRARNRNMDAQSIFQEWVIATVEN